MVCGTCAPVSPIPDCKFLCCAGHRKDSVAKGKEEETLGKHDIDFGNHIVGPGHPDDLRRVIPFPNELTPK